MEKIQQTCGNDAQVDIPTLRMLFSEYRSFLVSILDKQLIIPDFPTFKTHLDKIFNECAENTNGNVANYIPQLANVPNNMWGLSVCTIDGQRYSIGDCNVPFTIQSTSKPLVYGLVLKEFGADNVHKFVGYEPSGLQFNAFQLDVQERPYNPMINSGAIVACGILQNYVNPHKTPSENNCYVMDFIKSLAANEFVGFNQSVYESELATGFRNFTIGYLIKEKKVFPEDICIKDTLDLYFRTCSIEATCETMAVIGATLTNGGINPFGTFECGRRFGQEHVRDVLSIMGTCGVYDYSGTFSFEIGLPSKSGVSGAMLLVIPGVMAFGLYSPRIDVIGNSCRCIQFCKRLLEVFPLHPYARLDRRRAEALDPIRRDETIVVESPLHAHFAAARGDFETLRCWFLRGINMNALDLHKRTALHLAAVGGNMDCVRFLVEICKIPIDAEDEKGHTALQEAMTMQANNIEVLEYLKEAQEKKGNK